MNLTYIKKLMMNSAKSIFPQNLLNYLIIEKIKKITQLQKIIKSGGLDYKAKSEKKKFLKSIFVTSYFF